MKRFCSLFLILFSGLFLRNTAEGANADKASHSLYATIPHHKAAHALPANASMKKKKPAKGYTAILFRMGIEGKSIAIPYKARVETVSIFVPINDVTINSSWLKHILFFSGSFAIPQPFLLAFSNHAPPSLV